MERALVTGATGVIGPPLVQRLQDEGVAVQVLVRSTPPPETLPPDVAIHIGDIRDPQAVKRSAEGTDVIFHLAAKLHGTRRNHDPAAMADINVDGTRNVVAACGPARRLVLFSSINVYGPGDGVRVFDEDSEPRPQSAYAQSKVRAEQAAEELSDPVVLRLAPVYGSGMKGNYVRLFRAIERGRFFYVGSGANRRTLVHLDDVVRATVATMAGRAGVFNLTDGDIHTFQGIVAAISAAVGRPVPRFHVPLWTVKGPLIVATSGARLIRRRLPVDSEDLAKLTEDVAVSGDLLQRVSGFAPRVDLEQGWAAVARELRPSEA